jgi:hypothetical protein
MAAARMRGALEHIRSEMIAGPAKGPGFKQTRSRKASINACEELKADKYKPKANS